MKTTMDLLNLIVAKRGFEHDEQRNKDFEGKATVISRYTDGAPSTYEEIILNFDKDTFEVNLKGGEGEFDACDLADYFDL